jgi:hypothetical protein
LNSHRPSLRLCPRLTGARRKQNDQSDEKNLDRQDDGERSGSAFFMFDDFSYGAFVHFPTSTASFDAVVEQELQTSCGKQSESLGPFGGSPCRPFLQYCPISMMPISASLLRANCSNSWRNQMS